MIASIEITKRIFIWGVCAVAVVPRQHIDRTSCSIGGGRISHPFRKGVLASVALNFVRLVFKILSFPHIISDILGVVQIVSLSFLCFLTPYLLQTWLSTRINIKPGANLLTPLYTVAFLSMSGVALSRLVHRNLWCISLLGGFVSGLPVLQTLKLYNSVTSIGGYHAGRGTVLCQTLQAIEYWFMLSQLACAIAFGFNGLSADPLLNEALKGVQGVAFIALWTRIMAHSIFINLMDELVLTSPAQAHDDQGDIEEADAETVRMIVPVDRNRPVDAFEA